MCKITVSGVKNPIVKKVYENQNDLISDIILFHSSGTDCELSQKVEDVCDFVNGFFVGGKAEFVFSGLRFEVERVK